MDLWDEPPSNVSKEVISHPHGLIIYGSHGKIGDVLLLFFQHYSGYKPLDNWDANPSRLEVS